MVAAEGCGGKGGGPASGIAAFAICVPGGSAAGRSAR